LNILLLPVAVAAVKLVAAVAAVVLEDTEQRPVLVFLLVRLLQLLWVVAVLVQQLHTVVLMALTAVIQYFPPLPQPVVAVVHLPLTERGFPAQVVPEAQAVAVLNVAVLPVARRLRLDKVTLVAWAL
tara:strand:+ start:3294 stop:3674 length:381 start_codon:yes stop_codon:yes gene_type:complete